MSNNTIGCPIARAAMILGSRWTAQILRDLTDHGSRRFQDFQDSLEGVAPSTLSARLKMLEESGVVERKIYDERPPRAEYVLTAKGKKMNGILKAMHDWGAKYG